MFSELYKLPVLCLVLVLASTPSFTMAQTAQNPAAVWVTPSLDCEDVFKQLTENEDWFEQMVNPTLKTIEELVERVELYWKVYNCLPSDSDSLSDDQRILRLLTEYFLVFAGDFSSYNLSLINFEQIENDAIAQIRDEAGIAPPPGFVFIRWYPSREAMPGIVRQAFENEEVRGVTILTRYIAVLAEQNQEWYQEALQYQSLPKTISHELIHAYVNASLGLQGFNLPKWYHEGLAIYFSGSGENNTVITPNFTISTTSPKEYQQYENNFRYLESRLTRKQLLAQIKQSIEQADPSVLYRSLGIANDDEFVDRAEAWKQEQTIKRVAAVVVIGTAIVLVIMRILPEVKCKNCGYAGRKKDFQTGYCPKCNRPYNIQVFY